MTASGCSSHWEHVTLEIATVLARLTTTTAACMASLLAIEFGPRPDVLVQLNLPVVCHRS